MNVFFGLCSPSAVQSQVVPKKYVAGLETEQNDSPKRNIDLVRFKPQPSQVSDGQSRPANATVLSLDDELFLFVLDVKFKLSFMSNEAYCDNVSSLNCYSFEQSDHTFRSSLVLSLKGLVAKFRQLSTVNQQTPNSVTVGAEFSDHNLSTSCKSLNNLLNNHLRNGDSGSANAIAATVSPRTGNSPISNIGKGFYSVDYVLIVAVSNERNSFAF